MWKLQAKHLPINLTHQIGPLTDFTQTINSQSRRRRKESSKGDEKRPANPKKARPRRRRSMMTTKRRFLCSSVSVWNAESCSNHSFVTWTVQGGKEKIKRKKIVKMWNINFSLCSNRQNRNRTKTPIAAKWLRKVALVPSLSLQSLSLALWKVSPAARVRKLYPTAVFFSDAVSQYLFAPALQLHFTYLTDATRLSHLVTR